MFTCAECAVRVCRLGTKEGMPKNCPMQNQELIEKSKELYDPATREFARQSALVESKGYCRWSRVEEVINFSRSMGYGHLGIAFCTGLKKEAEILSRILRSHGFKVSSVMCKNGSIPKEFLGVKEEEKVRPGGFEAMCNPIGQALCLNSMETDFNIAVGLCVGHDSLFFKHSKAPVTVLIAKDRVLAHNPAGALYCAEGYYKDKMIPKK